MPEGFVDCEVENHHGAWLVTFDDDSTILLQSDYDQASFAVNNGFIVAPKDWDGSPSNLGAAFYDFDCSEICYCLCEYMEQSEMSEMPEQSDNG